MKGLCIACHSPTNRDPRAKYCWCCRGNGNKSRSAVSQAVKKGLIPKASVFDCVDCGKSAMQYDHRDYNKPLVVQPVCRSCNLQRGAAIPDLRGRTPDSQRRTVHKIVLSKEESIKFSDVLDAIGKSGFMRFINSQHQKLKQ